MRLLKWNSQDELCLTDDFAVEVPPYAILSHTWGADRDEVTFADIQNGQGQSKAGYAKIQFCGRRARTDGIDHFWVDTCCINKDNQNELSEAIVSMFRWYQNAQKCYVYLSDVTTDRNSNGHTQYSWESSFQTSRWFTRGWTLQELLAPRVVEFYSQEEDLLGDKKALVQQIHCITTIPTAALDGTPLAQFSIVERMRWTDKRETKKQEDRAYCLLGIFDVSMPLNYGERGYAFRRLEREINARFGSDVCNVRHPDAVVIPSLGMCLGTAPLIDPSSFVGRAAEIDAVTKILRPEEVVSEQRRAVLGGIGGVGKTQLAIAYARHQRASYPSVIWLNAISELTLHSNLRSVCQRLTTADELAKLDQQQVLARLHEWLSHPQNTRWLLIFDNYDDPDQFDIDMFCPNTGHGAIIITTRLPDLVTGTQVRMKPLQATDDSLHVLETRSGRDNVKADAGAHRLAERLAGLPLALVTAGAYLRRSAMTFSQYLDIYEQRWRIDPRRPVQLRDYQDRTLYTTWNISYGRLLTDDPDAAQVLQLLAYFGNEEIWYDLLEAGLSNESPTWLHTTLGEQVDFGSVMKTLTEYCLVEAHYTTQSYSVHSCVHDWILGALNEEINPQLYWYSFDCVANSIDDMDREVPGHVKYARLSHHGVRLLHHRFEHLSKLDDSFIERLAQADRIAEILADQASFSAAGQMLRRILAAKEEVLGPDDESTLYTINNLGSVYRRQGEFDGADQMLKRALVGKEKVLGPDHESTLYTINNLGLLYQRQGKLDEAEQILKEALIRKERLLGPDHISTLNTVNNLGYMYRDQGKLDEAEPMLQRALIGKENVLGPNHISTLNTVNNLGLVYADRGKLDEAEQMLERTLVGFQSVLGEGHKRTCIVMDNLTNLRDRRAEIDLPAC